MSSCKSSAPRKRLATIAASLMVIVATAPLLLRHTGSGDWSDAALGSVMGFGIGLGFVLLIFTLRQSKNAS